MKSFPTLLLATVVAAIALVGCAGGANPDGIDAPAIPELGAGGGNEPTFAPPPFLSPGASDEGIDDTGGSERPDPAPGSDRRSPNGDEGGNETPPIVCGENEVPPGTAGQAYNARITPSGGNGTFTFTLARGDELPTGLTLDESTGAISGIPTVAGKKDFAVKVTSAEKTKTCRGYVIEIVGDIRVESAFQVTSPQWKKIYKVVVAGEGISEATWSWEGDTSNICVTPISPDNVSYDITRENCSFDAQPGMAAYVFLKGDRHTGEELKLTLTVTNEDAGSAQTEFRFFSSSCGDGIADQGEACDAGADGNSTCDTSCRRITPPSKPTSISVHTRTGHIDSYVATDCRVTFKLCTDPEFSSCSRAVELNGSGNDREFGKLDIYEWKSAESVQESFGNMTDEHRYFQLALTQPCGEHTSSWLLQAIKVVIEYDGDATPYTYYNPGVLKWMDIRDTIRFGPDDVAVCADIKTENSDGAGTDDMVLLKLQGLPNNLEKVETSLSRTWSSHFEAAPSGGSATMPMYWDGDEGVDDFNRATRNQYCDFFFGQGPSTINSPTFSIIKRSDGKDGGWQPEMATVYVFNPGKIHNNIPAQGNSRVAFMKETGFREAIEDDHLESEEFSLDPIPNAEIRGAFDDLRKAISSISRTTGVRMTGGY